jgi:uncharacterized protein
VTTRTTPFAPGTPCWVDLFTSDPERSQTFYAAVLGWEFADQGSAYGGYVLATKDGERVAGLMRNAADSGSPDAWSTYLATADAETSVARASEAGARVLAPPLPVGDLGSMAVVVDPAGAVVGLWQAGDHTGFGRHDEPGSVVWTECHSKSLAASRQFYEAVAAWDYEVTGDSDDFRYLTAQVDGRPVAGLMDSARFLPDAVPSHWAVYLGVDDVDAAQALAEQHGGTVLMGATDTPFGRIADLVDPTGAPIKLHAGQLAGAPRAEGEPSL